MIHFCTLFNSIYLSRGLAMYRSLEKVCPAFHLYIFAFDDECHDLLKKLELTNATIISLSEFENEELLAVKPTRTAGEYCWTCTPSTIDFCINNYKLDHCTYIDADLFFFSDPKILLDELGTYKSILITEHRYTPEYNQSLTSGIYCVQFITFKNDKNGITALKWWKDACLEWCFNRMEDNKFGDQKYLDDWTERFEGVHVLKHLGGGVAPWNVQQYQFKKTKTGEIVGVESSSGESFPLIFYHFHQLKYCINNIFHLCVYHISKRSVKLLYKPYIANLLSTEFVANKIKPELKIHEKEIIPWWDRSPRRRLIMNVFKHYKNYYSQDYF